MRSEPGIGTVIADKYVLCERIGAGGMGVVFRAAQATPERTVAIKLLQPRYAKDPDFLHRFEQEAIAASRVSHPSSVTVIEWGKTHDGALYLVMEDLHGVNLGRIAARDGVLPLARVVEIVGQLLGALGEVHASGVVHGDIKTDNVVVETTASGDRARLIDFGLARIVDDAPRSRPDRCEVSGTPEYMAPEVVAGGQPTPASDLYSVGIVLYELLVGATPFGGGSVSAVMCSHLHDEVVPPSLRSPARGISPVLERIVLRALAKSPSERFPDAATFEAALRSALATLPTVVVHARGADDEAFSSDRPTRPWTPPPIRLARGSTSPDAPDLAAPPALDHAS